MGAEITIAYLENWRRIHTATTLCLSPLTTFYWQQLPKMRDVALSSTNYFHLVHFLLSSECIHYVKHFCSTYTDTCILQLMSVMDRQF
jgi:hypothetical protein